MTTRVTSDRSTGLPLVMIDIEFSAAVREHLVWVREPARTEGARR